MSLRADPCRSLLPRWLVNSTKHSPGIAQRNKALGNGALVICRLIIGATFTYILVFMKEPFVNSCLTLLQEEFSQELQC